MNILLTNDDGIDAPGLASLRIAAQQFGTVYVVAPMHCHSGCSHRLTTDSPIRFEKRSEQSWAINGTPADCVRLALNGLIPTIDWVFSGINAGGNLGVDIHLSGTVAAAREGALHGIPAIALSYYRPRGHQPNWSEASKCAKEVLGRLLAEPLVPLTFWNVNFPGLQEGQPTPTIARGPVDPNPLPISYARRDEHLVYDTDYHSRQRQPGSDVDHCFDGKIAMSLVRLTQDG